MTVPARQPSPSWPPIREWFTPATMILIAVAVIPLFGVLWWEWKVFPLMFLFWCENALIGMFNLLRMLILRISDPVTWLGKCFCLPFFCLHYGAFVLVHAIFVLTVFGGERSVTMGIFPDFTLLMGVVHEFYLGMPLLALIASHAFSFFYNFLYRGEFRTTRMEALMTRPYGRVLIHSLVILAGGFIAMTLGAPLWSLILLVALKTACDLAEHVREHCKAKIAPFYTCRKHSLK